VNDEAREEEVGTAEAGSRRGEEAEAWETAVEPVKARRRRRVAARGV
jgi:hypothetical protein